MTTKQQQQHYTVLPHLTTYCFKHVLAKVILVLDFVAINNQDLSESTVSDQ